MSNTPEQKKEIDVTKATFDEKGQLIGVEGLDDEQLDDIAGGSSNSGCVNGSCHHAE